LACVFALCSAAALAQTAPVPKAGASKPAAKGAAPAPIPQIRQATFAPTIAAKPAPKEKLLTRDELKACFSRQMKNEAEADDIKLAQTAYKKDYDQIRADQEAAQKEQAANRAKQAELSAERSAISAASQELQSKSLQNTKPTDADKAAWEAERTALVARAKTLDDGIVAYNAAQAATRSKAIAIDNRVPAINEQQKTVNARVEAFQAAHKAWRDECADKPYDEADEAVVKKELGMK
jgi:chromosome segregation ATPase